MTDILDLKGWTVLGRTEEDGADVLEAEYPQPMPTACPKCGTLDCIYRHGTKATTYVDIPMRAKPAKLRAKVQRYRCTSCKETFLQPLGGIVEGRRMTERCATYIKAHSLRDTFTRIAENVGCDDKTVRVLAAEYMAELEASHQPYMPDWLGMDETRIDGAMRCVITDVGERRVIDMLPDRDKATVAGWLHRFKDRHWVKGIAIDMWRPYRDVAAQMFPGRPVVIDKFHIVRMASEAMEKVRIRLQKKRRIAERRQWLRSKATLNMRYVKLGEKGRFNLDMWLANEPELAEAYRLKEAFYDIFDMPKEQAVAAFDSFAATVPTHLKADFRKLLTAMKNWRTEILAYFDHPITNAYTEALNGVAKTINRQGRGYTFEVLRARLLYGKGPAEPWRLATVYPANATQLQLLKKAQGNRCMSCGCEFGRTKETAAQVTTLVRGNTRRQMLICASCNVGFHTEALSQRKPPSTQQSG